MKFKVKFWNRRSNQQDEVSVEIDETSDGFHEKMAGMRLEDASFGLIDRTVDKMVEEISKGETVDSVTPC